MTVPTTSSQTDAQLDVVQVSFAVPAARELHAVLPWVLDALIDRPGLTDKQRRRREATRTALGGLMTQLGDGLQAHPAVDGQVNGT